MHTQSALFNQNLARMLVRTRDTLNFIRITPFVMHKFPFACVFQAGNPLKLRVYQIKKSDIFCAFHTTCEITRKKFKSEVKMEHPIVGPIRVGKLFKIICTVD